MYEVNPNFSYVIPQDQRRLNVGITRAQGALLMFGNVDTLARGGQVEI